MAPPPPLLVTWLGAARPPAWAARSIDPLGLDRLTRRTGAIAVAGTWPLAIALPDSDLDILVEAVDVPALKAELDHVYRGWPGYGSKTMDTADGPAVVARFPGTPVPMELFGQALPVTQQVAYRHMMVEARLLAAGGRPLQDAVRRLKRSGLKTEPAFARALGLPGDPYRDILNLERQPDAVLHALVGGRRTDR